MNITSDLFAEDQGTQLVNVDGNVIYWPSFLSPQEAQQLFNELLADTPWQQEAISVFGKIVNQPRLTAWYGEFGVSAAGGYKNLVAATNFSDNLINSFCRGFGPRLTTESSSNLCCMLSEELDSSSDSSTTIVLSFKAAILFLA